MRLSLVSLWILTRMKPLTQRALGGCEQDDDEGVLRGLWLAASKA